MIKNYFLIATRNLIKYKFFTIINVFGLAIGMSLSLLLIAMLSFIWKYDTFHVNEKKIYRVVSKVRDQSRVNDYASTPSVFAERLKDGITGIDKVIRINSSFSGEADCNNKKLPLNGYFVDPDFLNVFTFPLVKGNATTALNSPNSILITESAAYKFFGSDDPIGKLITMEGGEFQVTGLLQDIPQNSHMQFEILGSYQAYLNLRRDANARLDIMDELRSSYVYLLLEEASDAEKIETYLNSSAQEIYGNIKAFTISLSLQSLSSVAPGKELRAQIGPDWGYTSLSIFIFLTLLVLLPACFNYANISISRALKRMKEVGLRKTLGSQRHQIFMQFIVESILLTLIALGVSYYLFTLARAEFTTMLVNSSGLDLSPDFLTISYFVLFALTVGFFSGAVPALYFSKLNPIQALKSKPSGKGLARWNLGRLLIVGQLAFSFGFIMSVVVVFNQYRQTLNYNFGFDQANILNIELQNISPEIVRSEFSKHVAVQTISMSSHVLGTQASSSVWLKNLDQTDSTEVFQMFIDQYFIKNLNLKLIEGQTFEQELVATKKYAIVNEQFLNEFKINTPSEAIGKTFVQNDSLDITVIGVVKNFHYVNLKEPIKSFFFRFDPQQFNVANIKIASSDMQTSMVELESIWKAFGGDTKFEAQFHEDDIEESYSFYFSMIKICGFLGMMAITISCLGLLGMVVFTVDNRIKEVGIRKVMGSSISEIIVLLSKDFTRLMIIATIIAIPITYYFFEQVYFPMQAYNTPISITDVLLSLAILFALGFFTILSQTIKAARANPVDILRHE